MANFSPRNNILISPRLLLVIPGLLWGVCMTGGCGLADGSVASSPEVTVLAAASTKDLLQELAVEAERSLGMDLTISTGPSPALAQQILSDAPAELFISANRGWADEIDRAGRSVEQVDWLTNRLVLVVPAPSRVSLQHVSELRSPEIRRVALAGENVPAGIYARQALRHYGVWDHLQSEGKVVQGHDVRSTLAYVLRGEVDAAVVYATDVAKETRVQVVMPLDPASHEPAVYRLVLLSPGRDSAAAKRLFEFLQSPQAMKIARRNGFRSTEEVN